MATVKFYDFSNDGFGWICKSCERESEAREKDSSNHSRLMREGEAESKQPRLSNQALAKWADAARRVLICPRCGVTERAAES